MTRPSAYHHGDLRRALLDAAAEAIGESGPAALSLRDLARRAGVSHAAPAYHFGDKAGLLTALAAQGFDLLTRALRAAGDDLLEAGVAYVGFAVRHRAHFEVMFRPDLHRADDPELVAARARAGGVLRGGVARRTDRDPDADALAAWSIVHGFATLWLSGALPPRVGTDPEAAARAIAGRLFP
ncbi:TetR/AcrR family transcriptional regulator [Micromonospora okii]|uniref:TetR/AcrR family transcriptional regulator n=1 Tax=Micromonospora okii TaxID=1182970 RepID=UPI001E3B2E15|nr:TetR/AcrR family transcriptional regulator [Micromonospora okii]